MNIDDLRSKYNKQVTKYNKLIDDDLWADDYVLWLEKQLIIHSVSSSTDLIETKSESIISIGNTEYTIETTIITGENFGGQTTKIINTRNIS